MKIVGFLSNQISNRGTETALFSYAHYNETLLQNKSIILTKRIDNEEAYVMFENRFGIVHFFKNNKDLDEIVEKFNITHLYMIKSGENDHLLSTKCNNLIHCVFQSSQPHGDVYGVISDIVNKNSGTKFPIVPHIVSTFDTDEDLRNELGISQEKIVFGRYGGNDSFDIHFVIDVINKVLEMRNDVYFIFMNTDRNSNLHKNERLIFLPGTSDLQLKRKFINTCDAMLHARLRGESFGLSVGEFALSLKPIFTYSDSYEKNHIDVLKEKCVLYNNYNSLFYLILTFHKNKYNMRDNGYFQFTPEKVMTIFNNVFLKSRLTH